MCLAIPSLVVSASEPSAGAKSGIASAAGVKRTADFSLAPEATVGDFVVVHSGYAIAVIARNWAVETLEMLGIDSGSLT